MGVNALLRHMRGSVVIPTAAFLAALGAYVATLAPGVVGGDSGEMQFVPHVLGIAHWTGYPLYTMFGKLWELLVPVGSVAQRMNLLSAVASAAAVALACVAGRRLAGSWLGGLLAALMLGTSPLFWNWAIVAGVRSVTVFFAILNLALALEWGHASRERSPSAGRLLVGLAVAYGLSLAHHRTTAFLLPGLLIYVAWLDPALVRDWRRWLPALVLALAIPILLYLYIPLRSAMNPPYAIIEAHSLHGFMALVFAPNFAGGISAPLSPADLPPRLIDAVRQFEQEFTLPLFALGVAGILACVVRERREAVLLLIPFVLLVGFTVNYNLGTPDLNVVYLLPAYLIFSLFVACSAGAVSGLLGCWSRLGLVAGGLLVVAAAVYVVAYPARSTLQGIRALETRTLDAYRMELRGPQAGRLVQRSLPALPNGAVLIGDWEQLTPFWYSQLVDHAISDLVYHYPLETGWQEWVARARRSGRPVFLTRRSDQVIGQRFLSAAGPLVEVRSAPATDIPAGIIARNATFGDQMALVGYRYVGLEGTVMKAGAVLSVELFWTALRPLATNYSVSVRLVSEEGRVISSVDNTHPVLSMYPTSLWQPGEVVGDYYELSFAMGSGAGRHHVDVIVYAHEGGAFRNLVVQQDGRSGEALALPSFEVAAR